MPRKPKKYHYIYKTTCVITNRFYIGMRSTDKLPESYLGSGTELSKSVKKYGKQNHFKEILEYLDNRDNLKAKEKELISEDLRKDPMCMNLAKGGQGSSSTCGLVTVRDKDGNTFSCHHKDSRFLKGEVEGVTKNMIPVKDKNGCCFIIHKNDPRYLSGEVKHVTKGLITVKDKDGNYLSVSKNDPRYINGDLVHMLNGKITLQDKNGNYLSVSKNDPRYINGDLVHPMKGKKHSNESKELMSKKAKEYHASMKKANIKHQMLGTRWITNEKISKKISKTDLIPEGWRLGRKM